MARRFLPRFAAAAAALGTAGLVAAPLAAQSWHAAASVRLAAADASPSPQTATVSVKSDVAEGWDYDCANALQCAPRWDAQPAVAITQSYDLSVAQRNYDAIKSWFQFQADYFTKAGSDYSSIVRDQNTFVNYYLPPHRLAGDATSQWEGIYNSLNPAVEQLYRASVSKAVADLLNVAFTYQFKITNLPYGGDVNALGANQDYASLLVNANDKTALLGSVNDGAGAAALVMTALLNGDAAVPDLSQALKTSLFSRVNAALGDHASVYAAQRDVVAKQFAYTAEARKLVDSEQKRDVFDKTVTALRDAVNESATLRAKVNSDPELQLLLALRWDAAEVAERLADDRLAIKFGTISYQQAVVSDAATLAGELYVFGQAVQRIQAVSLANQFVPQSFSDFVQDYYGPYKIAQIITSFAKLTNLDGSVPDNPSLLDLLNQYQSLKDSGRFAEADLDAYLDKAIAALLNGQPISQLLADLVAKAQDGNADPQAVQDALDKIAAEGLNADTFADLLTQLRILADISEKVTSYVFIAVGGAVGLIALASGYTLLRGFNAKRRYGASLVEYVRSKNMLTAVALTAAALAVALIVIAAAGVV